MTRNLTMFEPFPHSSSLRIALIAFPTLVTATVAYVDRPVLGMQSSHRSNLSFRGYRSGPDANAVDENGSDDISVATDRAIKNGCYEPYIPGGTHSV